MKVEFEKGPAAEADLDPARPLQSLFKMAMRQRGLFLAILTLAGKPLVASLPASGMGFLILGGVFYSLGTVFYLWKKLPYHHAVWHLFVLAGALSHYFLLLFYVLPQKV